MWVCLRGNARGPMTADLLNKALENPGLCDYTEVLISFFVKSA